MKYVLAAVAVVVLGATPASAAKAKMMNCSAGGPAKMTTMTMAMPYDEKRMMMHKSLADVNKAMSKGDMRACNKAMMQGQRAAMMKSKMM